jgi:hypothetical protein
MHDTKTLEAHGLKPDEYERIKTLLGPSSAFSVMWSEHCSYKLARPPRRPAHQGPARHPGPRRERGRRRHRRRLRGGLQDGVAQPPLVHRALPGRGHRRGRHPARHLHHGRAAHRQPRLAALRRLDHPRTARARFAAWSRASAATATASASPRSAASSSSTRLRRQHPRERLHLRPVPPIASSRAASGVGNPVIYVGARTGRDGIHGATMASDEFDEGSREKRPPCRWAIPSWRSSCSRPAWRIFADRHRRHPGHGRRRAHLRRRSRWPRAAAATGSISTSTRPARAKARSRPTR